MRVRCFGANICESDFFFDSADSTRHSFRLPTVPSCVTEAGALKATLPRITGSWSSGWESAALTGDLESGKEAKAPAADCYKHQQTSKPGWRRRDGNTAVPHRRVQSPDSSFIGVKRQL